MSKGFLVFAQNSENGNYIQQAYALALSIKISQKTVRNISLVTNDVVPEEYKSVFDQIIEIPWVTEDIDSRYKAEHRWKLYHVAPYDETIVLDADMLLLEDISTWWDQCSNYEINYCSRIKNYKLETVTDTFYRKTFIENQLTSPYAALHYFKQCDTAYEFYKVLEFVCNNWEWCYDKFAPKEYQNCLSMDLATAIAIEISGIYDCIDNCSPLEFIHMRPMLQGWDLISEHWQDAVPAALNSKGDLLVGNIKQSRIFHYMEKDFLSKSILDKLEELYGKKEKNS